MKTVDISPLIRILMTVIALSIATGQFKKLQAFATRQAIKSSKGWTTPHFFNYGTNKLGQSTVAPCSSLGIRASSCCRSLSEIPCADNLLCRAFLTSARSVVF